MTTGQELVDAFFTFEGQTYSTAPGRTNPNSAHKDCSGGIVAAHILATGRGIYFENGRAADVSSTLYALCRDEGLLVPYEDGIHIAGGLGFKPDDPLDGIGPRGHVVMFTGDGLTTIEATPPRVQHLPISYNAPFAPVVGLLPGIDYTNGGRGTPTDQEDDMKGTFIKTADEPWIWFFVNGYRMPTTNSAHIDLIAFFQQSRNGNGDVAVLSAEQMAAIPVWDPDAPTTTIPGDCPAEADVLAAATPEHLADELVARAKRK